MINNTTEFEEIVKNIIAQGAIKHIVETGTFLGLGSTLVLARTGLPVDTIECNKIHFDIAQVNLRGFPNVMCHYGWTLPPEKMLEFIQTDHYDFPEHVRRDHPDPVAFYTEELKSNGWSNLLPAMLRHPGPRLVFLDSAGGVGWLEYQAVMKLEPAEREITWLLMDDVSHVKHYRSVEDLVHRGYKVNFSTDQEQAWCNLKL